MSKLELIHQQKREQKFWKIDWTKVFFDDLNKSFERSIASPVKRYRWEFPDDLIKSFERSIASPVKNYASATTSSPEKAVSSTMDGAKPILGFVCFGHVDIVTCAIVCIFKGNHCPKFGPLEAAISHG